MGECLIAVPAIWWLRLAALRVRLAAFLARHDKEGLPGGIDRGQEEAAERPEVLQ